MIILAAVLASVILEVMYHSTRRVSIGNEETTDTHELEMNTKASFTTGGAKPYMEFYNDLPMPNTNGI